MSAILKQGKLAAAVAAAAMVVASCGGVTYKLPDEYLGDGDLLAAAMKEAAAKFGANPQLQPDNGPYILKSLAAEDDPSVMLYQRFEDVLAAELAGRSLEVVPAETEGAAVVEYRFVECRIVNAKAEGGWVKRVGRAIVHLRIYGKEGGEMFWAGECQGEFENVVPKNVVRKLTDERIVQIGPQQPAAGQNPFIEPLLVTGITGALIYLFAVSASSQ